MTRTAVTSPVALSLTACSGGAAPRGGGGGPVIVTATGRGPFTGEIGAHESKPNAMRVLYYGLASSAFASVGVQSCAWGYTNTFHFWRDATGWEPGVADAMVTTTTLPPG